MSQREAEVLRRAATGLSNKEIGSELRIAVKTVEAHKANAMRKLGCVNKHQAVLKALRQGLIR